MGAKKRQTFGKRDRERAVREKRARKEEKKEQRKLDAIAAANGNVVTDGDELTDEVAAEEEPEQQQTG